MSKKRNTKLALASLMAVSAIAPVVASADTNGSVTTEAGTSRSTEAQVTKTIDFKVEEETGMLAKYIPGTGTLVEQGGQQYIQLNLTEAMLGMVTAITVDGKTALHEYGGKKMVLIPVTAEYAPVEVDFAITSPYVTGEFKVTLTPKADSIKEVEEEKPETPEVKPETPSKPTTPYGEIADGKYEVTFDAYDPKTDEGNYTAITRQLESKATLVVENGKYFLEVSATEQSNGMITEYQVLIGDEYVKAETVSGSVEKYPHVVRLPLASLNDLTTAKLHVVVPAANMDKWYDFKISVDKGLDLPEKEKAAEEVPVYVYKDGSNELSIMAGVYLSNTATVTDKGIDVVFPQGQYLKGFEVEGATVALKSEEVVDKNTVKIYTIQTKDTSKIYTATVDVNVNVAGVSYDTKHKVQLQFGGKQNPFTDIQKLDNYSAIVNLYSAGIFKENEKFNPQNPTTRSQFSLMLYRALEVEVPATTAFKDIAKLDAEAQSAIKALNSLGVINGVNKETFAPYNNITRAQTAKMIYRLLVSFGYQDQANAAMPFSDVAASDAELNKAATQLNALGIMTGSNGKLNPNAPLTRNQMAKVLNNALEVLVGLE